MFKFKTWISLTVLALAATLPAPQAQASELAKLGKLLVTGKRAPASPEPAKPAAAAVRETTATTPSATSRNAESGGERSLPAARWLPELPSLDLLQELGESRGDAPAQGSKPPPGERVGRAKLVQFNQA